MTRTDFANQREALAALLRAWIVKTRTQPTPRSEFNDALRPFPPADPDTVTRLLVHGGPAVDLSTQDQWIIGSSTTSRRTALPVATVAIVEDDASIKGTLRVAVFHDASGLIDATGYRFESPEPDGSPHDFPHAQSISGWHIRQHCLLEPHLPGEDVTDCRINRAMTYGVDPPEDLSAPPVPMAHGEKPAFPLLAGRTLPGLAASMLVALYGREYVRELADTDAKLRNPRDADIREDLNAVV